MEAEKGALVCFDKAFTISAMYCATGTNRHLAHHIIGMVAERVVITLGNADKIGWKVQQVGAAVMPDF